MVTGVVLLLLTLVAGCASSEVPGPGRAPLRTSLFLAIGATREETLDTAFQKEIRSKMVGLVEAFRMLEPGVRVQLQVIGEDRLAGVLFSRNLSGLGPDLVLVTQQMGEQLAERNLIRPIQLPPEVAAQFQDIPLQRTRLPDGRFLGLPLTVFPQVACFDRRNVARSPVTVEELEQKIASGLRVSLPVEPAELAWTIGSLGAMDSFIAVHERQEVKPENRERIRGWLLWLRDLGLMQRFSYSIDPNRARQGLSEGDLDWISCRSDELGRLRLKLGEHLGVAPLPSGPGGAPSPVSQLWILAFGVNSDQRQRAAAERLGSFTANPQMQRVMTLRGMEALPVNRSVDVPVESSFVLRSLVTARDQGRNADPLVRALHPAYPFAMALRRTLSEFLFGLKDVETATDEVIDILQRRGKP